MTPVREVYVFLTIEERDGVDVEAVVAATGKDGSVHPLVAIDEERMRALAPIAQQIADLSGISIVLAQYTERTDIQRIEPQAEAVRG